MCAPLLGVAVPHRGASVAAPNLGKEIERALILREESKDVRRRGDRLAGLHDSLVDPSVDLVAKARGIDASTILHAERRLFEQYAQDLSFEGERLYGCTGVTALRERRFVVRREVCAVGEKPAIPKVVDVHLQATGDVDAPSVPLFARSEAADERLGPRRSTRRRVEAGAQALDLRIDSKL